MDRIHTAIAENSKITFQYFQWNVEKKMELRHDGVLYEVSPWSLSWDDENYYFLRLYLLIRMASQKKSQGLLWNLSVNRQSGKQEKREVNLER